MSRRPRRATTVVIPVVALLRAVAVLLVVGAGIALVASGAPGRAAGGSTVAGPAVVAEQRDTAVRNIGRGYEQATDQVRKAHALKLAIGAQQADAIAAKALSDLATLRHSALVSLAQTSGTGGDPEAYAKTTEQALDAARGQPRPSTAPVLLAPRLYAIVARFDQLATAISDQATADLTQSPSPAPSPRPTASPTPTR